MHLLCDWQSYFFFRTKQSRRGENIETCETLEEAAKYNKPVCAERLWNEMNQKQDEMNNALVTAAEHDSYDVIKV